MKNMWAYGLALLLAVGAGSLSPYLFIERFETIATTIFFLMLVIFYSLIWLRLLRDSVFSLASSGFLLFFVMSGMVAVLDISAPIPVRWWPLGPREIPGILGVFVFLVCITEWSFRITIGTWKEFRGNIRKKSHGGLEITAFFLPVPFLLLWLVVAGLFSGKNPTFMVLAAVAVVLVLGQICLCVDWIAVLWRRIKGYLRKMVLGYWENDRVFIYFVFLFAFAIRAAFAFSLNKAVLDPTLLGGPDSGVYDDVGWKLASGLRDLTDPSLNIYAHNAGPGLFYALVYKVVGHRPDIVRYIHALLGAVSIVILFRLGVIWFGPLAARIGALLMAGRGYLIIYGTYLGSEALGLFLLSLLLVVLSRLQSGSWQKENLSSGWHALVGGCLMGALILTRPEYQGFALIGVFWLLRVVRGCRVQVLAGWIIGTLLLTIPLMARNYTALGQFRLNKPEVMQTAFNMPSLNKKIGIRPIRIFDGRYIRNTLSFLVSSPLNATRTIGGDLLLNFYEFWNWKRYVKTPGFVYFVSNERTIMWVGAFLTIMLMVGIFSGMDRISLLSLLYIFVGYKVLLHLFLYTHEWWRFTVEPLLNLFQGYGLFLVCDYFVRNKMGRALKFTALGR